MLGAADEGKSLARQHGIGVAAAALDGHDVDLDVVEQILGDADIERQIAGAMNRLGDQHPLGVRGRDPGCCGQRHAGRGGAEKLPSVAVLPAEFSSDGFPRLHDKRLLCIPDYCLTPLRNTLSSHDTATYMATASVESTSTATHT